MSSNGFDACDGAPLKPLTESRCAAVALIFVDGADGHELCFVKRQVYPGDPWSGQMALPGGKRNPEDTTPHDVARREAFEEVGVTLSDADLVGMMPRMTAVPVACASATGLVLYRLHGLDRITIGDGVAEDTGFRFGICGIGRTGRRWSGAAVSSPAYSTASG